MRKPAGIIFDIGETILHYVSSDWLSGTRRLLELADNSRGLTAETLEPTSTELVKELFALREQSLLELRYENFIRLLCETTGVSLRVSYEDAVREMCQASLTFEPTEGVGDVLCQLESAEIRMGAVSNSSFSGEILREELDTYSLTRYFGFVPSSADYGLRKPSPRLVNLAVKKLGVEPSDTWFVGDRIDIDVAGALQAGLYPVWYDPRKERLPVGYPCDQVANWHDFLAIVNSLPALEGGT